MSPILPSGINCSSCRKEIDLFEGPIRMIGQPKRFPFCAQCWKDLLSSDLFSLRNVAFEERKGELRLWLSKEP